MQGLTTKQSLLKPSELINRFWYFKYAPKTPDELALPDATIQRIKNVIENPKENLSNMLFVGIQGSGKTTVARMIIRSTIRSPIDLAEMNGSEVKIEHINEIKTFASAPPRKSPVKILFLDEFDSASTKFYHAFRNVIETYATNMTVLATANYIMRIPDPIRSRFQIFHFNEIPFDKALKRVVWILEQEKVEYNLEVVKQILRTYLPDLRTVIQTLQMYTITDKDGKRKLVIDDEVIQVNNEIRRLLLQFIQAKHVDTRLFNEILSKVRVMSALLRADEILRELLFQADFELQPIIARYYEKVYSLPFDVLFAGLMAEIIQAKQKFRDEQNPISFVK